MGPEQAGRYRGSGFLQRGGPGRRAGRHAPTDRRPAAAEPARGVGPAASRRARPGPQPSPAGPPGPQASFAGPGGPQPSPAGPPGPQASFAGPGGSAVTPSSGRAGWPPQAAPRRNVLRSGTGSSRSQPHRPTRRPAGPTHLGKTAPAGRTLAPGPDRTFRATARDWGAGHAEQNPQQASWPPPEAPASPSPATAVRRPAAARRHPGRTGRGLLVHPTVPGDPRPGRNAAGHPG
jgi:hypothetical protein